MYKYDKGYFDKRAKETGFIRDNLEKVFRLADILEYINRNPLHKDCLALKGGTAINLVVFNMPRLSVDIDLDFCKPVSREEMLEYRKKINEDLITFLQTQGYSLNLEKGKNPHSLDSWIFWYINSAGNKDNIKVEINYSMRVHVLPIIEMPIQTDFLERSFPIKVLSPLELFGSKINALIGRRAARDLYDIDNMIYFGTFDESELPMLKKCFLFYFAVGSSKEYDTTFDLSGIDSLNWSKIKQTLLPMLRRSEHFDLEVSKKRVKGFLSELLVLDSKEKEFLQRFKDK
ncbi:nucleotidyl transferase AbiEii/AbiGii toxin family protein, partial [Sporolituus thermophilus]